jgi:hypothetical protein
MPPVIFNGGGGWPPAQSFHDWKIARSRLLEFTGPSVHHRFSNFGRKKMDYNAARMKKGDSA